jgi:hypothetical protein
MSISFSGEGPHQLPRAQAAMPVAEGDAITIAFRISVRNQLDLVYVPMSRDVAAMLLGHLQAMLAG